MSTQQTAALQGIRDSIDEKLYARGARLSMSLIMESSDEEVIQESRELHSHCMTRLQELRDEATIERQKSQRPSRLIHRIFRR